MKHTTTDQGLELAPITGRFGTTVQVTAEHESPDYLWLTTRLAGDPLSTAVEVPLDAARELALQLHWMIGNHPGNAR